jgi:HAE1 family hydrophobic/amphiphilic exporter-1
VRLAASDRDTPADFDALMIVGTSGELIPLEAVIDVREVRGWARVYRVDRMRTVTVQGDVDTSVVNAQALVSKALADFVPDLRERYPDVLIDVQGETRESADTGGSIARNAFLGILGVYALLAFQFRSYGTPLVVMCVIPTILIGVFWGHLAVGIDLSMASIVGMTSLAGVVVNNSILLMQFTYAARERGLSAEDAAYQAGINRFRPILLTTLTTVVGLLPLLTERSLQAQVLIPLATSLAFGLAATTFIALFLVPSLYCVIEDFRRQPSTEDTAVPTPSV